MKYKLMPYVYAQAKQCTEQGLPMVRALCIEFPNDPAVWSVEDEYMFGHDILVAPMLEQGTKRSVYLPGGKWIDYQSNKVYSSGWNTIEAGHIPAVILVRDGAVIPHIALAQSTDKMDWSKIDLKVYATDINKAEGLLCLPSDNLLKTVHLKKVADKWLVEENPLKGKSELNVSR